MNRILQSNALLLLIVLLGLVINDIEELEFVDTLRSRNDAEPVTELHFLEELLGPVGELARPCGSAYSLSRTGT